MHRLLSALTVVAIGAGIGLLAVAPPAGASTHADKPILPGVNMPDPGFAKFGSSYYVYATGAGFRFSKASSLLGTWSQPRNSMTATPAWVAQDGGAKNLWAPHVFAIDGRTLDYNYVMYFSGRSGATGQNCIGVATAVVPEGPFTPKSSPLICPPAGWHEAIDPTMYLAANGDRYIVYKTGTNGNTETHIDAREVYPLSGTALLPGSTVHTLVSAKGAANLVEAPDLTRHDGTVFMFVSRGGYGSCDYNTQVLSAPRC